MKLPQTPSQTVGPYFAYGLTPEQYHYDFASWATENLTSENPTNVTLVGHIFDGEGKPIPDAVIEIWQDDGENQFFGRCGTGTDAQNRFFFRTEKPCAHDGNAPFLTVIVFMRGQLIHSFTRIYFSDEEKANADDPVLKSVPAARRQTLIARKNGPVYEFDIRMQGAGETVFFDF